MNYIKYKNIETGNVPAFFKIAEGVSEPTFCKQQAKGGSETP